MQLFEINEAIKAVLDKDDLDPVMLKDTLDSLKITREEKLDGLAGAIEQSTADADFLTSKIRKLQDQKRFAENRIKNLNSYMTDVMDNANLKTLKTKHYILKPRNYRAKTVITDEHRVPKNYFVEKLDVKIDKTAIYKDLKDGKQITGAHLEPNRKTTIN